METIAENYQALGRPERLPFTNFPALSRNLVSLSLFPVVSCPGNPELARCRGEQSCASLEARISESSKRQNARSFRCIGLAVRSRYVTRGNEPVTKTGQRNWLLSTSNVVVDVDVGPRVSARWWDSRASCLRTTNLTPSPPFPRCKRAEFRRIEGRSNLSPPKWKWRRAVRGLSNIALQSSKPKRDVAYPLASRQTVRCDLSRPRLHPRPRPSSSVIIMPTGIAAVRYFGCKSFKFLRRWRTTNTYTHRHFRWKHRYFYYSCTTLARAPR